MAVMTVTCSSGCSAYYLKDSKPMSWFLSQVRRKSWVPGKTVPFLCLSGEEFPFSRCQQWQEDSPAPWGVPFLLWYLHSDEAGPLRTCQKSISEWAGVKQAWWILEVFRWSDTGKDYWQPSTWVRAPGESLPECPHWFYEGLQFAQLFLNGCHL